MQTRASLSPTSAPGWASLPPESTGFFYENLANVRGAPFYVITSGTLTIDESGGDKVSGSIDVTSAHYMS